MNMDIRAPEQRSQRSELIALSEKDLGEIARFIAKQSRRPRATVESHLQWFLLENPARGENDPLGFGLIVADQLAACILCVPQSFHIGHEKIMLMGSSSFYVDDHHRGQGGRIFLKYSRLAKQWPLFGTSANTEAAALWKAAGAEPIPYSDGELFGVLHWPPVAEEVVHRKYSSWFLSRLAGSPVSHLARLLWPLKIETENCGTLQQLTSAEQVNDLPIHACVTKLTAMRDLAYIRWRYFSGRDQTTSAFAFRSRQPDQEVLVTVNQRTRGFRDQIKTLNVLDVYPEVPAEEWLRIVGALLARFQKTVDAVVLRNQNQEMQDLFCRRGFQLRTFDAPTGWYLDKAHLLPHSDWYPVPADGDGLI
jgi:GNAT superfamily N-acetyltransferase